MRATAWILASLLLAAVPVIRADELADGIAAVRKKDYYNAVRLLMPLAQANNAEAQLQLGDLYYHGHGVKESDEEALRWYERAARQGLSQAQFLAGNMYAYGLGVAATDLEADRKREAQYGLAILILAGKGVERDEGEAYKWMKRAAEQGHEDAKRYVSR
jgi:TPR repeat protein